MDTIENSWIQKKPNRLFIEWKDLPFNHTCTISWRGVLFQIQIKAFAFENGSTRTASFIYHNERYKYSLSKWKYLGGSNGKLPEIKTSTHVLKIGLILNSLLLTEEKVNEENPVSLLSQNSFLVFPTPARINFDDEGKVTDTMISK
jgi:hypothetical protein